MGSESIFESLIQHAFEQDCLENHRVHLIRYIIQKYVKTRLYYIGKHISSDHNHQRDSFEPS